MATTNGPTNAQPPFPVSPQAGAIARDLLRMGAVKLSPKAPFTWSSGLRSPIYCDNRATISHLPVRQRLIDAFVEQIQALGQPVPAVAAVATGAIAYGAWVAHQLQLPLAYVRPTPKSHGLGQQVEGDLAPGTPVVLLEDLVSTGGSSLRAVEALRQAGHPVLALIAIFSYGLPQANQAIERAKVPARFLCNFGWIRQAALEDGLLDASALDDIQRWLDDPQGHPLNA